MNQIDSLQGPGPSTRHSEVIARVITLLVLVGFGIFAFVASLEAGLGSLPNPGPGMWPMITSVGIVIPAVALVFADRIGDYEPWSRKSLRLVLALAVLFLYIPVFLTVGFLFSSFILLIVWLRWFGGESWRSTLLVAAASSAGLFVLLDVLLGVPLPSLLL